MERKDWVNLVKIICVVLIVIFGGVYLFSRDSILDCYTLTAKGSLGDAVNGLSAPIISFFSALLIFVTFKEQIKANKLISEQFEVDKFNDWNKWNEGVDNLKAIMNL